MKAFAEFPDACECNSRDSFASPRRTSRRRKLAGAISATAPTRLDRATVLSSGKAHPAPSPRRQPLLSRAEVHARCQRIWLRMARRASINAISTTGARSFRRSTSSRCPDARGRSLLEASLVMCSAKAGPKSNLDLDQCGVSCADINSGSVVELSKVTRSVFDPKSERPKHVTAG